ncbi:hypothetical protein [Bacillus sp. AK031]
MFLLTAQSSAFNGGDILFQLIMFILLLGIPAAIVIIFVVLRKRNKSRLDRIEEKIDRLLEEKK